MSFAGCSLSGNSRPLFELVPSSSFIAVSINWRAVSKDDELKHLLRADAAEKVFKELGIGGDEVSEIVLFSDAPNPAGNGSGGNDGVLLRGSYKAQNVVARLKAEGWREESYEGSKILSKAITGGACAALKSNAMICGTKAGVEQTIDAERNAKASFAANPAYTKMIERLRKSKSPILLIASFPQEMQDIAETTLQVSSAALDVAHLGGFGSIMEKLGSVRGFGCALSRRGSELPVEMLALMKDEQAAGLASGTLNIMQKLTLAAPKGNLSQHDMDGLRKLQDMSVTRNREVLSIKAVMPIKDFKRSG